MINKRKILLVNEASFLATGFSNYGLEILKRLSNNPKYEVAELGTYVGPEDPRIQSVKWKFYAGQPAQNDKKGLEEYNKPAIQWGRQVNLSQFGDWALTKVLLDFKPDFVIGIMDHWMSTPVADNPLRKFYKWIYMPCIDSTPMREEWLRLMESADYLTGYSDFAINVMNEQSVRIKTAGVRKLLPMPTRPGVDMQTFKPMDKKTIREKWRLQPDLPIILSCMRNQARKMFCEIIDSFADYKISNPDDPIAQKAIYLIHSSGYDNGQEYWTHLMRISTKPWMPHYCKDILKSVLHTYMCDGCGSKHIDYAIKLLEPRIENGHIYIQCAACGEWKCRTPNTNLGYSREELAEIFNLADLYVGCSIAGADEMPITEAKACGVPIITGANAAMEEKSVKIKDKNADGSEYTMHLGGMPVKIGYWFTEASTMQTRAYFDRVDLTKKLKVLSDKVKLKELSDGALKAVAENCDYDKTIKRWEYIFDNLVPKDRSLTWDKQINQEDLPIMGNINVPDLPDEEFVDWCYTSILKSTVDAVGRKSWINDLKNGRPRLDVVQFFVNTANKDKQAEYYLWQHRNHIMQQEQMKTIQVNPNLLKGVLCQ